MRAPGGDGDTVQRDRSLHGSEQRLIRGRRMLRESSRKGFVRQPDQTVVIWRELWSLGMRLESIEYVRYVLAFVGSESRHINQRLHSFGACQRYHHTGIGMSRQYDWPFGPVQAPVKGDHIIAKRGQRKRSRQHLNPFCS